MVNKSWNIWNMFSGAYMGLYSKWMLLKLPIQKSSGWLGSPISRHTKIETTWNATARIFQGHSKAVRRITQRQPGLIYEHGQSWISCTNKYRFHVGIIYGIIPVTYYPILYIYVKTSATITGWWYTYPSEKWWTSSLGMMIPFPTFHGKS